MATHWWAPAGLFPSSHSYPNRFQKKLAAPLRGRGGPGHFEAARDGIAALARSEATLPAKTLVSRGAASAIAKVDSFSHEGRRERDAQFVFAES